MVPDGLVISAVGLFVDSWYFVGMQRSDGSTDPIDFGAIFLVLEES